MFLLSRKTHELVEEYIVHHKVMSTQLGTIMGELRKAGKPHLVCSSQLVLPDGHELGCFLW